jgi:pyruvate/2-oxoacid:ferredoxin oxidoreductase beta subunit
MPTKTVKIDKERYDRVMWSRVCPGCGDFRVVDVCRRSRSDVLDRSKYLGSFHACGGQLGHRCWNMTMYSAKKPTAALRETFGPGRG